MHNKNNLVLDLAVLYLAVSLSFLESNAFFSGLSQTKKKSRNSRRPADAPGVVCRPKQVF